MPSHEPRLSAAAREMRFSAIRRMSALIERPGIISFAPGQPSPETFPVEAFRQILDEVVEKESAGAFQYILTRGLGDLLTAVGEYAAAKGMRARPALHDKVIDRTPSNRWGQPPDLAGAGVFYCSPASDFVTGTALPVDGGFSSSMF